VALPLPSCVLLVDLRAGGAASQPHKMQAAGRLPPRIRPPTTCARFLAAGPAAARDHQPRGRRQRRHRLLALPRQAQRSEAPHRHSTAQHIEARPPQNLPPDAPGNINQLVLRLAPYVEELRRHHGVIAEFVNPKYADASRSIFKSSTRLECMMQVREGGRGQGAQGLHCA
jgi:hypothetical protein